MSLYFTLSLLLKTKIYCKSDKKFSLAWTRRRIPKELVASPICFITHHSSIQCTDMNKQMFSHLFSTVFIKIVSIIKNNNKQTQASNLKKYLKQNECINSCCYITASPVFCNNQSYVTIKSYYAWIYQYNPDLNSFKIYWFTQFLLSFKILIHIKTN